MRSRIHAGAARRRLGRPHAHERIDFSSLDAGNAGGLVGYERLAIQSRVQRPVGRSASARYQTHATEPNIIKTGESSFLRRPQRPLSPKMSGNRGNLLFPNRQVARILLRPSTLHGRGRASVVCRDVCSCDLERIPTLFQARICGHGLCPARVQLRHQNKQHGFHTIPSIALTLFVRAFWINPLNPHRHADQVSNSLATPIRAACLAVRDRAGSLRQFWTCAAASRCLAT